MDAEEIRTTEKRIYETLSALESTLKENLECEKRIKEQQAQIRDLVEQCEHARKVQTIVEGLCTLAIILIFIIGLWGCQ